MRLQQVITGACNDKPYAASVGRFHNTSFVVYCKAFDIVVMYGDNFQLHQVLGQPKDVDNIAECVSWDTSCSRIAAAYGKTVIVYEPKFARELTGKHPYRWVEVLRLEHQSPVHVVTWGRLGRLLATGSDELRVFARPDEDIVALEKSRHEQSSQMSEERESEEDDFWGEKEEARELKKQLKAQEKQREIEKKEAQQKANIEKPDGGDLVFRVQMIVSIPLAKPVFHLRFSPDGQFLATAGMFDRLVKVWWRRDSILETETSTQTPQRSVIASKGDHLTKEKLLWTFSYLPHPRAVTGLQWREACPLSYRRFQNAAVLMTSCCDRVSRVWVGNCGWTSDVLRFHLAAVVEAGVPTPPTSTPIAKPKKTATYRDTRMHTDNTTTPLLVTSQSRYSSVNWLPGPLLCLSTRDSKFDLERELALDRSRAKKFSRDLLGRGQPTWRQTTKSVNTTVDGGSKCSGETHNYTHTCRGLEDYSFAFQDDGSFMVWKIEGVDSQPRCIPQVSIVAHMLDVIPPHQAKRISYEVLAIFGSDGYNKGSGTTSNEKTSSSTAARASMNDGAESCTPTEIALVARGSDGSLFRWKLLLLNTNDQLSFLGLEYDTICSGHTVKISHIKSHPEKPILLSMGTEVYRDRSELIVWATRPVRVMEGNLKPLTSIARVKAQGVWDPALMSWFPHQPAFVAIIEGSLGVWCIRTVDSSSGIDNTGEGTEHQDGDAEGNSSLTHVGHMSVITSGAEYAPDVISLHVFGVADDESIVHAPVRTPDSACELVHKAKCVKQSTKSIAAGSGDIRYYLVGLLKDGRTAVVWFVRLGADMNVIESNVIGGKPYDLGLPENVSISYLTRPFTTRLQHTSDITGAEREETHDCLLLVSGCTDGVMRMWHCRIARARQEADQDIRRQAEDDSLVTWIQLLATKPIDATRTGYLTAKAASPTRVATKWKHSNTIHVWECVSTGGYESRLESTITFPDTECIFSFDWMDGGDGGSPVLAVGAGVRMHLYTQFTSDVFQPSGVEFREMHSFSLDCVTPGEGEGVVEPMSFRWTQDGSFVVGFADRMMVFSKWLLDAEVDAFRKGLANPGLYFNPKQIPGSVFELANACERPLPQYHPRQLHQLIMTNKFATAVDVVMYLGSELRRYKKQKEEANERDVDDISMDILEEVEKKKKEKDIKEDTIIECAPFLPVAIWGKESNVNEEICDAESKDDYGELFTMEIGDDDDQPFALGGTKAKGRAKKLTLTDVLKLMEEIPLPLITPREQVKVMAIVDTMKMAKDIGGGLDVCGFRAFCSIKLWSYMRKCDPHLASSRISATDAFWALHSESQETILELALSNNLIKLNWDDLRAIRFGLWVKSPNTLKKYVETLARNQFSDTRKPLDVSLWYVALNKKSLLASLCKSAGDQRTHKFFMNDFTEERWHSAAQKNAYVLMGQQRFVESAAFFLLAGNIRDAVSICVKNLKDMQMAVVVCRLYEGESGETMQWLLREHFLTKNEADRNIAMQSIGHWLLKDYPQALRCLFNEPWHRTIAAAVTNDVSRPASPYTPDGSFNSNSRSASPNIAQSLSHMRAMAAFGSTVRDNEALAAKTAAASGMVNLDITGDHEQDEWYNPIITNCAQYLRGHTLLQNVKLEREGVIRRVAEAMYSELHTGCMMVAIETLSRLREGGGDLFNAPAGRELKSVSGIAMLQPQSTSAITAAPTTQGSDAFAFDMGAFGGFDDFSEPEPQKNVDAVSVKGESTADGAEEESIINHTQGIVCDILNTAVAHQIGLRLLIRSMEQMRSVAQWSVVSPFVRGEAVILKDSYGVVGHGADSPDKAGAEALLDALSFYYRMHDDLTIEIKMLGVLGYHDQILFQLQDQSRNMVLGIPYATYMRKPNTRGTGASRKHTNSTTNPNCNDSNAEIVIDANTTSEHEYSHSYERRTRSSAAALHADVDDIPSVYLMHVFEKTSHTISDSVSQLLSNADQLPPGPVSDRLLSLRLLGESFLVVYAGLFVSSWWSCGLDRMQDLLVNVPSYGLFTDIFENTESENITSGTSVGIGLPRGVTSNWCPTISSLHKDKVVVDPNARPSFRLKPAMMTEYFLRVIDFNDFSEDIDILVDSDDDTSSIGSNESNYSAKLLDAILNEDKNRLTPDEIREHKERDAYVYAVLRFACIQLATLSMQRFVVDLQLGDMDGIYETSPLLYSLLVVFEAWAAQVEDYTQRLPAPRNILMLPDYLEMTDNTPHLNQSTHHPNTNTTTLNIPTSTQGGSGGGSMSSSYTPKGSRQPSRSSSPMPGSGGISGGESDGDAANNNPFEHKRQIKRTSTEYKLTALLDHKNNPFRKHSPVLRKLWYYIVRQEHVRAILVRLLFHEEFDPDIRDPELGEELFRDTDSVRSFCLNTSDAGQFAVCTGKGSHWRTPQKSLKNKRIPLVAALRRRSMTAASKNLIREQKNQEREMRKERKAAEEAQQVIRKALKAAKSSGLGSVSRNSSNDVSLDSFDDSESSQKNSCIKMDSSTGNKASPSVNDLSSMVMGHHKNIMSIKSSGSVSSIDGSHSVTPVLAAFDQSPHTLTNSVALQRKKSATQLNKLEAHPKLPYYLAGSHSGRIQLYLFSQEGIQYEFQGIGRSPITSIRFDMFGNKFGVCDQKGMFGMWRFGTEAQYHSPLRTVQAHNKFTSDFAFLNSASFVATGGSSSNSRNVCLWDFLVPPNSSLVKGFQCHTTGYSTSLAYASGRQALLSGGKKGDLTLFDIRQRRVLHRFNAHEGAITSIAVDKSEQTIFTGSSDGTVRIWDMDTYEQMNCISAHKRERSFLSMTIDVGVTQVRYHEDFLYTCGSDGTVRRWG
eukprot:CFRG7867T1